jgi:energy-coupling factor transport system permease protein
MSAMLSEIAIGSYLPGTSVLHRLDPRVKLCGLVLLMAGVFWYRSIVGVLTATISVVCVALISGIGCGVWLGSLARFKWMFAAVAAFNLLFHSGGSEIVLAGRDLQLTYGGLQNSFLMTLQLVDAVVLSVALTFTTTPVDLAKGMQRLANPLKRLHVPVDELGVVLLLAIRFVPLLQRELSNTIEAQKARGVEFGGQGLVSRAGEFVAILLPALLGTVRRSESLAVAMSARGFRPGATRTEFKPLAFKRIDWTACTLLLCWQFCCAILQY